jgi:hypothetical protein
MKTKKPKEISTYELEAKFEAGDDISEHVDWNSVVKIINLSLPAWVIKALDKEAKRIGIDRQAVIKTWIVERLDQGQNVKVKLGG